MPTINNSSDATPSYIHDLELERPLHQTNRSSYLVFNNERSPSSSSDPDARCVSEDIVFSNEAEEIGASSSNNPSMKLIQSQLRINPGTPDIDVRRKTKSY